MSTISQNPSMQIRSRLPYGGASGAAPSTEGDRVELDGSACPNIGRCQRTGAGNPAEPLTVSIILKHPKEVKVSSNPFAPVSREAFAEYASTPAQISTVEKFAKQNGLSVASVDARAHTVKLTGSTADVGKAFGVKLEQFKDAEGNEFRGYTGNVRLSKDLSSVVDGVFGLQNRPIAKPHIVVNKDARFSLGYSATDIANLYNFPQGTDGSGQTIGIIELGGGYQKSDLDQYFTGLGMKTPNVKAVSVDGGQNVPGGDPSGADGEVELDVELAGGVAPGANIVVYFAPNTEQGFIDAINQAAHDTENHPNTLSISWGAPEKEWSAQGLTGMSNAIKDAAAMGVNVYAAAGDNGSADGEKDGKNHADFPASAPYSIGCGGTKLKSKHGHITSETVWNSGWLGGATGGGVSDVFPLPDYQKGTANVPAPTNPAGGRGVPDVAGNANPFTGYAVVVDGTKVPVGGTSAVAPIYAGLTARLGQGVGGSLGFLSPTFYQHQDAFHDITYGDNGAFSAGPGWDATTGVGTPDGTKILDALKAIQQQQPPPSPSAGK